MGRKNPTLALDHGKAVSCHRLQISSASSFTDNHIISRTRCFLDESGLLYDKPRFEMDFPPGLPKGISFPLHLSQKPLPQSFLPPTVETAGYRTPGAKALGQVPPRRAGTQNPQDPIDDRAMVLPRSSGCRFLGRQQRHQSPPLIIRQISSSRTPHLSIQLVSSSLVPSIEFANTP